MDKIIELYQSQIDEMIENAKKEAYQEVYDQMDEGVCEFCSHNGEPRCFVTCSGYDYEKETIMKWLKEKAGEKN